MLLGRTGFGTVPSFESDAHWNIGSAAPALIVMSSGSIGADFWLFQFLGDPGGVRAIPYPSGLSLLAIADLKYKTPGFFAKKIMSGFWVFLQDSPQTNPEDQRLCYEELVLVSLQCVKLLSRLVPMVRHGVGIFPPRIEAWTVGAAAS